MQPETQRNPYQETWHGFLIYGFPDKIGYCEAYVCRVTRGHTRVFDFEGRAIHGDNFYATLEGRIDLLDTKRVALARVRAIIDLRSYAGGKKIERRLFDFQRAGMEPRELGHRLLGVFYTLFKELPHSYEHEGVDVEGLWMELGVSENECISELKYLTGKRWLKPASVVQRDYGELYITADGIYQYRLLGQPPSTVEVFVSYRVADTLRKVQPLGYKLKKELGEDTVFIAPRDVRAGFWHEKIWKVISLCKVMLVLIGPLWLTVEGDDGQRRLDDPKDILRREIETAFDEGKTVIPVLFDAVEMPAEEDLPDSPLRKLLECQRYRIDADRWDDDTDELIKALEVELGRPAAGGM